MPEDKWNRRPIEAAQARRTEELEAEVAGLRGKLGMVRKANESFGLAAAKYLEPPGTKQDEIFVARMIGCSDEIHRILSTTPAPLAVLDTKMVLFKQGFEEIAKQAFRNGMKSAVDPITVIVYLRGDGDGRG
jgi:hypothetical protein